MCKNIFRINPILLFKRFHSQDITFKPLNPSLILRASKFQEELTRLESLMAQNNNSGGGFNVEQQKKYAKLCSITDALKEYQANYEQFKELEEMVKQDPTLSEDAEEEIKEIYPNLEKSKQLLFHKLLPPHPFADKSCLLELRPGVGGTEAMIFAQDLLNMYINYAHHKKWAYRVVSETENEQGNGIVEAILAIDEPGSYDRMKFESGVHRVQRIPATETKGRTHTSTAAVVVLPQMGGEDERETDAYERTFKPEEIRIDVMRARGKGGQHVNTTDSAVRLTHYPSGIVVSMQDERSQHKNKAKAFGILRAKLAELERKEKEEKARKARTDQVTSTDRSDKIRTYNYPQNRITDHRCNFSILDMESVMNGQKFDALIDSMEKYDNDIKAKQLLNNVGQN
ncbi:probable Peptide chain release factor 1, mitochondrial [Saccharomycodes ludwigii]|uniref:Peptide chain release factor 1, mitochondrial n=1 Tax=Saccharomycodes ludwigii TaxID=36035 RepID=A0A376B6X5_9ASCO|nr:hypothetical protein SCDLUD_002704 [Saccharomycodes ludwigii]KAH3901218.1 hypothetical protein SCDLUD_002704 [Saccharomycodes ludwigii]SSD60433.1 probable Peptide chain release factor 1, mitochondrial [Saccharomycodes ludwigii]